MRHNFTLLTAAGLAATPIVVSTGFAAAFDLAGAARAGERAAEYRLPPRDSHFGFPSAPTPAIDRSSENAETVLGLTPTPGSGT